MGKANTFKDHNGNRGTIGSKVIHWHLTISERTTEDEKTKNTKIVEDIVTMGRSGTKIKLKGESVYQPANQYVILKK